MELFFSWISREPEEEEDDEGEVGLGGGYLEPALVKRDDIRLLGKIIKDTKAVTQLKLTRNINAAYRSSDRIFSERQQAAVTSVSNEIDTLGQMTIRGEYLHELENSLGRLQTIIDRTKSAGLSGVEQTNVYHDRIDAHFTELSIADYKRLKKIKISKLSRINLFAGINNCGKTTLLEAVYLLCRQNDFNGLLEVVRRRGKLTRERLNPKWFMDQLSNETSISGCFDQSHTEIRIRPYREEEAEIDKSRYLGSIEITSSYENKKQESLTRIFQGRERETQTTGMKILCSSVFSSPFFLNEPHRYAPFYRGS